MATSRTRFRIARAALVMSPVALALASAVLLAQSQTRPAIPLRIEPTAEELSPYAADPNDLWNRLHRALFLRDPSGTRPRLHQTDPLLYKGEMRLLRGETYQTAITLLDQFLADPRAQAGRAAISRLFLQHDLWAAFDHVAWRADNWVYFEKDEPAAIALRTRLARAVGILALTDREIAALPDNYADAVRSGRFTGAFDPEQPDRAFLPAGLFDPKGPWVGIAKLNQDKPFSQSHFEHSGGRAVHMVLLNLPGGRAATEKFLTEWSPQNVTHFPAGTMVALVRRLLTVDQHGNPRITPVTELLQIRVYREVPDVPEQERFNPQGLQSAYEFMLDRAAYTRGNDGIRIVGPDEPALDFNRSSTAQNFNGASQMSTCLTCHAHAGVYSTSLARSLDGPRPLPSATFRVSPWDQQVNTTTYYKTRQFDWGLLQGMLEATR